jgi:predicted ABC-type ATPase
LNIADEVLIFDNSEGAYELIAEKTLESEVFVENSLKFEMLKNYYNEGI